MAPAQAAPRSAGKKRCVSKLDTASARCTPRRWRRVRRAGGRGAKRARPTGPPRSGRRRASLRTRRAIQHARRRARRVVAHGGGGSSSRSQGDLCLRLHFSFSARGGRGCCCGGGGGRAPAGLTRRAAAGGDAGWHARRAALAAGNHQARRQKARDVSVRTRTALEIKIRLHGCHRKCGRTGGARRPGKTRLRFFLQLRA